MATTDDIKGDINDLNQIAKTQQSDKKLKEKLSELISFDVDAKQ